MTVGRFSFPAAKNEKENMAYTSGLLKYRVTILNKQVATGFGETTPYQPAATVWADITWKKGQKALNEGALDAQDTVLIRMRYNKIVSRDSQLQHDGVTYQIQSFHRDYQENIIQITATEIVK
jgi:SPP1 family predicted phage head-tail adaptor